MFDFKSCQPIIITGMHRSGTTLLVKILSSFGLYTGYNLDSNLESFFFLRLNEWFMRTAGGSWEYPSAVKHFLSNKERFNGAVELVSKELASRRFYEYSGCLNDLIFNSKVKYKSPWGWKDPRNIFTMPIWNEVFPNAKLLYIKRNGVDVAKSLLVRAQKNAKDRVFPFDSFTSAQRVRKCIKPIDFNFRIFISARCFSLEESFKLWVEYCEEAEFLYKQHKGSKMIIKYEDLLADPVNNLKEILTFVGLSYDTQTLHNFTKEFDSTRRYSFRTDVDLVNFCKEYACLSQIYMKDYDV